MSTPTYRHMIGTVLEQRERAERHVISGMGSEETASIWRMIEVTLRELEAYEKAYSPSSTVPKRCPTCGFVHEARVPRLT